MAAGVPEGCHSLQPYVFFRDATVAIAFYVRAFGATERLRIKGPDGRIAHAELQVGDSCLMLGDENAAMDSHSAEQLGGSPVAMMLYTTDCDAMYRQAIDAGAISLREPMDEPYGARMAGVRDPFGYTWWVATQHTAMTRLELEGLGS